MAPKSEVHFPIDQAYSWLPPQRHCRAHPVLAAVQSPPLGRIEGPLLPTNVLSTKILLPALFAACALCFCCTCVQPPSKLTDTLFIRSVPGTGDEKTKLQSSLQFSTAR